MKSLNSFVALHRADADNIRIGQRFCNMFLKRGHEVPGLFYERNEQKAIAMIRQWLVDNHHTEELPQPVVY